MANLFYAGARMSISWSVSKVIRLLSAEGSLTCSTRARVKTSRGADEVNLLVESSQRNQLNRNDPKKSYVDGKNDKSGFLHQSKFSQRLSLYTFTGIFHLQKINWQKYACVFHTVVRARAPATQICNFVESDNSILDTFLQECRFHYLYQHRNFTRGGAMPSSPRNVLSCTHAGEEKRGEKGYFSSSLLVYKESVY